MMLQRSTVYNDITPSGDMDVIMNSIMLVVYDEEGRIRDIINSLIESKEVEDLEGFTKV